MTKLFLVISK